MINPILASSALRRMCSARALIVALGYVAVILIMLGLGMSSLLFGRTIRLNNLYMAGNTTYMLLMLVQFALVVLVAPAMTAGSIAGERERQTLDLLLVTNTGSLRIVSGKLMESFAYLALLIVLSLPVMCLPMLLGGVTLAQVLMGTLFLLVCALAAACVGVVCSSLMKSTMTATVVSYLMILLIAVATTLPLVTGIDRREITDVIYDTNAYTAMTGKDALRLIPKLLLLNPGVGLISLIEDQTAMLQSTIASGQGRLYAMFQLLEKIGYPAVAMLNMAFMAAVGLLCILTAAWRIRPGQMRKRK